MPSRSRPCAKPVPARGGCAPGWWLVLLATVLAASPAWARADFEWPDWNVLQRTYPDAPAFYLLDETVSEVGYYGGDDYGRRVEVRKVVAILDPRRAQDWLTWDVVNTENHLLIRLEARTWTSPDASHRVEKDDLHDVTLFPDYVLYADIRARRFAFPAVAPRTVVELRYTYSSPSVYSFNEHVFAHSIPTLVSRMRLVVPRRLLAEEFDQAIRAAGITAKPASRLLPRPQGEVKEFTWEMRDLPAMTFEPQMPPPGAVAPAVRFAPLAPERWGYGWAWMGRRYYDDLVLPRMDPTPQIRELAARLTAGQPNAVDKVKAIYRWVQSDIRYVAIEIGIGGFQPHSVREVLKNRYGDCKDKVGLFLSLLDEAGIDGFAALVRTREQGAADTALFSLGQFNHMIAWLPIGERGWWLDPTAEDCLPDYLPAADQGVMALVVGPGVVRFLETPVLPPERSTTERRVTGTLDEQGNLSGTLEIRVSGEAGMRYRAAVRARGEKEREQLADGLLARSLRGARTTGVRIGGLETGPLVVAVDFSWPGCATAAGDALALPGDFLAPPDWGTPFRRAERVYPVVFDVLEQWRDRIRIVPPAGYRGEAPLGVAEPGRCFSFFRDAGTDSGAVRLDRTFELEALDLPAADFSSAREEFERARVAYTEPIRFRRAP